MTNVEIQTAPFDYAGLDTETRIIVQQRTGEIKTIARRAATDVIEIGQKLVDVRDRLGARRFEPWLKAELGWTDNTAYRFIQVFQRFGESIGPNMGLIAPTALYMLAAPSVPDEARSAALQRAEAGERITVAKAQQIVTEHMPAWAAVADLVEPLRVFALTAAQGDVTVARAILKQISERSPQHLSGAADAPTLAQHKPFRMADLATAAGQALTALRAPARVVTFAPDELAAGQPEPVRAPLNGKSQCGVCGRPLSDPASIARGAGDVCSGQHNGNGHGSRTPALGPGLYAPAVPEPEPTPAFTPAELADVVDAWLDERIDNYDLAEGDDARRYALNAILAGRNGAHNQGWRSLAACKQWPAAASTDDKLTGIRACLRRLNGEPEPAPVIVHTAPLTPAVRVDLQPALAAVRRGSVLTQLAAGLHDLLDELIALAAELEDPNERLAEAIETAQRLAELAEGAAQA